MLAARPGELRLSCSEQLWRDYGPSSLHTLWLVIGEGTKRDDADTTDYVLGSLLGAGQLVRVWHAEDGHLILDARERVKSKGPCVD